MSRIIAINNQKGGVGKTTTSVNLAACLAAAGYPTLLVDMDPQANATSAVGLNPRETPPALYHALIGREQISPVPLVDRIPNLSILPANNDLAGVELDFAQMTEGREFCLRAVLEPLRARFPFIIIDTPPSLSLLTINVLVASDHVVVPVQAEFLSLEGLSNVISVIDRIREAHNPDLSLLGIAITLYDGRTRLATEVVQALENSFPDKIFSSRIVRNIRLSEAPSHGLPIIYYDLKSAGATSYIQFTEEVIHACEKTGSGTGN